MERLRSTYSGLSGGSPKDVHLELVNMTLLRKRCNSVKYLKRKSSWMMQVDPKSNAKCPYKQRKRQNWKGHKWEVIWWRKQRLEQCGQEPPEMGGFSLTDFLGSAALPASWFQGPGFQNRERRGFCCFNLPNMQSPLQQPLGKERSGQEGQQVRTRVLRRGAVTPDFRDTIKGEEGDLPQSQGACPCIFL